MGKVRWVRTVTKWKTRRKQVGDNRNKFYVVKVEKPPKAIAKTLVITPNEAKRLKM